MTNFIFSPNLPEKKVKSVICTAADERVLDFFERKGIRALTVEINPLIDPAVSNHADMAALHIGKEKIIVDKNQSRLAKELKSLGMTVILSNEACTGEYPKDIGLNFALFSDFAVGKLKYADESLKKLFPFKKTVNVNQGYCKCSILIVNENAIITDDESICRKMLENGIECLLIEKGDVTLQGHEYGFIGGASGKISQDEVVFFGDIKNHRDYEKIRHFINSHNCSIACTDSGYLRDIGGMIPIVEE